MNKLYNLIKVVATIACTSALSSSAVAASPKLNSGDTAWMLTSTALVLMMSIPGLALFYGGMVRKKNVLSIFMQCFAVCCLALLAELALLWSFLTREMYALLAYLA